MERIKIAIENGPVFGDSDNDKTITDFEVLFDTIDNHARVKNSNIVLKLCIEGKFDQADESGTMPKLHDLFSWSKEKTAPSNYRFVDVEIYTSDANKASRKYHFVDMFVLDYKECYSTDGISFQLSLNQKQGNGLDKITSEILKSE